MKIEEAKMEFIQTWGTLGSAWGIPKSMAQIHALLLSHHKELSTEEIMEIIQLSRGNVNVNIRELISWKLAQKKHILGERKEFFIANHDVWDVAINIMKERKRKELEPVQDLIRHLKQEKLEGAKSEVVHFKKILNELDDFVSQMDQLSELMFKLNKNMFFKRMIKILG